MVFPGPPGTTGGWDREENEENNWKVSSDNGHSSGNKLLIGIRPFGVFRLTCDSAHYRRRLTEAAAAAAAALG